ncbi:hypothetical protein FKM82_019669 [Ascaphus truei]
MPHPRWRRSGRAGRGGIRKATLEETKHYKAPKGNGAGGHANRAHVDREKQGPRRWDKRAAQSAAEATPRAGTPYTDTPASAAAPDPCADTPTTPTGASLTDTPAPLADVPLTP